MTDPTGGFRKSLGKACPPLDDPQDQCLQHVAAEADEPNVVERVNPLRNLVRTLQEVSKVLSLVGTIDPALLVT